MREKDGKLIPEVGDVWVDEKHMVHIIRIFTLSDNTRAIVYIYNNNTIVERSIREEYFIKMFSFAGRSKASIKDLFEVDDATSTDIIDRNIRKENMRLQAEIKRLRDLLKQCIPAAEFAKDKGLADMINKALNGESSKF